MLGILEVSIVGGIALAGIDRLRRRQITSADGAFNVRKKVVALLDDLQSLTTDVTLAVEAAWQPVAPTERSFVPRHQPKRYLVSLLASDPLVPASRRVQSTLLYADQSPWKEQTVPEVELEGAQGMMPTTTPAGKLGMADARLVARYVRRYWSPYAVIGITTGVALIGFSAYRLLFARTLQVVADRALTAGGGAAIKRAITTLAVALPATVGITLVGERLGARLSYN